MYAGGTSTIRLIGVTAAGGTVGVAATMDLVDIHSRREDFALRLGCGSATLCLRVELRLTLAGFSVREVIHSMR